MKRDQVVVSQETKNLSSLSNPQTLTIVTLQKQRKKISHQEGMKEKVPELNLQIREIIGMKEIDLLKEERIFLGTNVFSMGIVSFVLTLVLKL
jgi:hypothetical protein